jgi:RND family efflux transporter MFP subunit
MAMTVSLCPVATTPSPPTEDARPRRRRWPLLGLSLLLPAGLPLLAAGCNQEPPPRPRKAPEVVVTTPVRGQVVDYQDFTGRLDGFRTVEIRARVSGYITEAPFKEGDHVKKGDLLFQIDTRPYDAALNQAEANLKVATADRNLQSKNAVRARQMIESKSLAREDYDAMIAAEEKARATVGAMEAARDQAQLNLDFTHVIAPIGGRVSRRSVDPGNLVLADNTMLTTVVSDNELYAYFDVDERTYLNLLGPLRASQASWLEALHFPVLMSLANEGEKFDHVGKVDFIDNRVTATTGTIRMRGVFDNAPGFLKSGLFVRIRLPLGQPYSTLFVPGEALQSDQGRDYVYVVVKDDKDDKDANKGKVARRYLKVGQTVQGLRDPLPAGASSLGLLASPSGQGPVLAAAALFPGTPGLRVVKEGLAADDQVIVSGQQRVRERDQVVVKKEPPLPPPDSPLVRLLAGKPASERTLSTGR